MWEVADGDHQVEMAIREWLRIQQSEFYRDGIFKLVPIWDMCDIVSGGPS